SAHALLQPVVQSFLGDTAADVEHVQVQSGGHTLHVALYPNDLVLAWIERSASDTTLYELAAEQSRFAFARGAAGFSAFEALEDELEPLSNRWLVYGAYRIDR